MFELSPKEKVGGKKHILYFHGEANVNTFIKFHRKFIGSLVQASGCTVTAPDYPLAPEHTYVESIAMAGTLQGPGFFSCTCGSGIDGRLVRRRGGPGASPENAGKLYACNANPNHFLVRPINEPLKGLGKITVFIGINPERNVNYRLCPLM